jgi:hypothetical protein
MYRRLFKLALPSLPIIPLIVLPKTLQNYHAFFWDSKHKTNFIDNRVFIDV